VKQIPINELTIYNSGKIIYCHPDNYYKVKKQIKFIEKDGFTPDYIFRPNFIQIRTNYLLEKEKQIGWIRGQTLPDHPFVIFVEEEELVEPKSWQIFFGLVVPKTEPLVYIVNDLFFRPHSLLKFRHSYSYLVANSS
jgi:hypothetical protein